MKSAIARAASGGACVAVITVAMIFPLARTTIQPVVHRAWFEAERVAGRRSSIGQSSTSTTRAACMADLGSNDRGRETADRQTDRIVRLGWLNGDGRLMLCRLADKMMPPEDDVVRRVAAWRRRRASGS